VRKSTACRLCCYFAAAPPDFAGSNTIAVLVTNTAESSDAGFDLDLVYSSPLPSLEAPGPVTAVSSSSQTSSITLKWTKPACDGSSFVTSYAVNVASTVSGATGTGMKTFAVTDPFATSITQAVTGLKSKTKYTFSIQAMNAAGASTAVSVTATTK
jgi:hypothetical protein